MQRAIGIFAAPAAIVVGLALAAPAWAGFGAVAYDQNTQKYGASFDQPTQSQAFEAALKQCASKDCRVHPVEPKGCGALAMSAKDKAWGGADRPTLDDAQHDAVVRCQAHTKEGDCTVRASGCNK